MSNEKKLSIGVQSFSKMIEENYVYVDKTKHIYDLIKQGSYYFLSRPRRFGKSLLISTLKELFVGNRKLFESTFIGQSDYAWAEYPVIHLDFSAMSSKTAEDLERDLLRTLERIAISHNLDTSEEVSIPLTTVALVEHLAKKNKVVFLIDEYDYPLLNNIENVDVARKCRNILGEFFTTLKKVDDHLKFIFITGITKFSKTSIFSGLNNLKDITLHPMAANLVGYTFDEINACFAYYLDKHFNEAGQSKESILNSMQFWYNGYQFSENIEKIYNPFSVLLYLADGKFLNYWFDTGTPTFLVYLIKTQNFPVFSIEGSEVNIADTKSFEIDQIRLIPLLWQTGYLTIKSYNPESKNYTLAFPNEEVRTSFLYYFMHYLTGAQTSMMANYSLKLAHALRKNDVDDFFKTLTIFFANIPYTLQLPLEKYYQSIFYVLLNVLGLNTESEVTTNDGRIDAVIVTETHCYIIEFKINQSAKLALSQIEEKQYHTKYKNSGKKIVLVGANFDTEKRNLDGWEFKSI